MAPELAIFLDRLAMKSTRLQKSSPPEAIERVEITGSPEHCLETRQQQRHRQHILAVVAEDRVQNVGITIAKPGKVAARGQTPPQGIPAREIEHPLPPPLQGAVPH